MIEVFDHVSSAENGMVRLTGPTAALEVPKEYLRIAPMKRETRLQILSDTGKAKGYYCAISEALATDLSNLEVSSLGKKRKPKLPSWKTAQFTLSTKLGDKPVTGITWGGYGIAQYHIDDDGAVLADPKPELTLTHLKSGLSCIPVSQSFSLHVLKRAAIAFSIAAPSLARVKSAALLPAAQATAVRVLFDEMRAGQWAPMTVSLERVS